ncbi:EAL domain-containing protein [Methylobacterium sp. P1-11]|nr:EAL domain-containing protein [Methylobacterium sp. P1-11]
MPAKFQTKSQLHLAIIGLLSVLTVDGGAAWLGWKSRLWIEGSARRNLQNLALTISEQTKQALDGIDLVHKGIVSQIESKDVRTTDRFDVLAGTEAWHNILLDRMSGLQQLQSIQLIDNTGKLINSSGMWPMSDLNVSDRDYFQYFRVDPSRSYFISQPLENRIGGRIIVYLTRPVRDPDGRILGLVLAGLRIPYFEDFYRAVSLEPDSAITLLRDDGVALARHPKVSSPPPVRVAADSPLFTEVLPHSDHGTFRQLSSLDGADRFISVRKVKQYPAVVAVSAKADQILSRWNQAAATLFAVAALLNLLIVVAVLLGRKLIRNKVRAEYTSCHDPLTGLANRRSFHEEIDNALKSKKEFSIALVDLDNFKTVNDVLGHCVGDELLQRVGRIFDGILQPGDMVARLGGDEFAFISYSRMDQISSKILENLNEPIELADRRLSIGASIGVAVYPRDGTDTNGLIRRADMALYEAKSSGKNVTRYFHEAMEHAVFEKQTLETDLREAVSANQLELYLQPIVRLEDGSPTGYEALLRWHHPVRGIVSPMEFIPIAESSGLIVPIGEWIVREACRTAANWSAPLMISVNLSSVQFASEGLVETIKNALFEAGLPAHRLEVEITETVLLETDPSVLAALHNLRNLGVRIALDDFGTGYSSLSYLTSFPFDRIKIDRSFVKNILTNSNSATIVCATIALAESLGLECTTEGVETIDQARFLRKAGSTAAQGFLFGRPVPAVQISERIASGNVFRHHTGEAEREPKSKGLLRPVDADVE